MTAGEFYSCCFFFWLYYKVREDETGYDPDRMDGLVLACAKQLLLTAMWRKAVSTLLNEACAYTKRRFAACSACVSYSNK
jgi:hypothetical protein